MAIRRRGAPSRSATAATSICFAGELSSASIARSFSTLYPVNSSAVISCVAACTKHVHHQHDPQNLRLLHMHAYVHVRRCSTYRYKDAPA